MNTKSIVLAGALSLSLVNMASAVNYVYITGSTAARGQVYNTLVDPGVVFDAAPTVVAQGNATASKCTYMNFSGTIGGVATTVKCDWSGSEAGITDISGSGTESFLDDSAGNSSSSPGPFISSTVDICMADNAKAFSRNPSVCTSGGAFVGVIPFFWVKEKGSLADISNMTACAARVLLAGGNPAALVTGNSADTTWVYVTGRDHNSGTRVNTFGDTGFGIFSTPYQLEVAANGSMIDQGGGTYLGDYGYSGGGSVATQMGYDLGAATSQDVYTGSLLHFSVVAYLGYSDAGTAVSNGGTDLTYEGVAESTAAVREGQYQFWGNEWVYIRCSPSSQATTVFGKLSPAATGINAHADNLALIDLRTMDATRNGPTSDCVHN
jgi:hypothetical protein